MATAALFENPAAWINTPRQAFEAYIASEEFLQNSRGKPRAGEKIRQGSAKVYLAQWSKFERWLDDRRVTFASADTAEIRRFLQDGLDAGRAKAASPATRQRYMQLLERIYARAAFQGAIGSNPVAELLTDRRFKTSRAKMPTNADRATVQKLQRWLGKKLDEALKDSSIGRWREARDITMASLALGSGLRCKEIAVLSASQIRREADAGTRAKFEISISRTQTTATAKSHSSVADLASSSLLDIWLDFRFGLLATHMREAMLPAQTVFPATLNGLRKNARLSDSAIYVNMKRLAQEAVDAQILDEDTRWILDTGATGLRRARILLDLKADVDQDLMTIRLGYWEKRAVRRYEEELDKAGR